MAKNEKKQKRRLSPAEKATNVVLAIVVIAVLALAAWAVTPKVKEGYKRIQEEKAQEQQMQEELNAPMTVSKAAESMGVSVDDFKAEFGLGDDVTAESEVDAIFTDEFVDTLPLGKFAKMMLGMVKEDGTALSDEEAFATLDEYYQFEDSVTAETKYSDAKDYMKEYDDKMQAAQEEAQAAEAQAAEAQAEVVQEEN